jgi:hypothetical protein
MKLRRWQVVALRITLISFFGTVILLTVLVGLVVSNIPRKAGAPHVDAAPRRADVAAEPDLQLESHTCGLHSLSAAYRVYGLSPVEENLRERLGVDTLANPLDATSKGTLHPDLLRVLVQDGFACTFIDPEDADAGAALTAHLVSGDAALLLIARRENAHLHWVMSDECTEGRLRIVDSLAPAAYREPLEKFLSSSVLSILTLHPSQGTEARGELPAAHAAGLAEMERVRRRLARRDDK